MGEKRVDKNFQYDTPGDLVITFLSEVVYSLHIHVHTCTLYLYIMYTVVSLHDMHLYMDMEQLYEEHVCALVPHQGSCVYIIMISISFKQPPRTERK